VDNSDRPDSLLQYLDDTDTSMAALKAYVAAAARRYVPGGLILDLGCGVGHDLVRLRTAGLRPIGLDPSSHALSRAVALHSGVVRGDGARLPFGTSVLDGCRIERVLQHVADPGAVLDEVVRVVRPGGFIAILEPDHTSLRVEAATADANLLGRWPSPRHPAIGVKIEDLLRERGCHVDDVVTELSFGYALDRIPVTADLTLQRAVAAGALATRDRDAWLEEQRERSSNGTFQASWVKVLVVARTPGEGRAEGGRVRVAADVEERAEPARPFLPQPEFVGPREIN
jgi:SAM-dependent methyltransferase